MVQDYLAQFSQDDLACHEKIGQYRLCDLKTSCTSNKIGRKAVKV